MKKWSNIAIAVLLSANLYAQSEPPKKQSEGFAKGIERVLSDFPYDYKNITGELAIAQGEWEEYYSLVVLPGAETCRVTRFHSVLDTTSSWRAVMFRGENFKDASAAYKRLFRALNACKMKAVDGSVFYLDGELENPSEGLDFVTSILTVQTADYRYRDFKVELELLYKLDEWVVSIFAASKQKDDKMKPDWMQ